VVTRGRDGCDDKATHTDQSEFELDSSASTVPTLPVSVSDLIYNAQHPRICPLNRQFVLLIASNDNVKKAEIHCLDGEAVSVLEMKSVRAQCFVKMTVHSLQGMTDMHLFYGCGNDNTTNQAPSQA
jgi:hypothetical protein